MISVRKATAAKMEWSECKASAYISKCNKKGMFNDLQSFCMLSGMNKKGGRPSWFANTNDTQVIISRIDAKYKKLQKQCLYAIKVEGDDYFKIGVAFDTKKRLSQIQNGNHRRVFLYATGRMMERNIAAKTERTVLTGLRNERVHGEWFCIKDYNLVDMIFQFVQ